MNDTTKSRDATVRLSIDGPVATITLDRPERHNALHLAGLRHLSDTIHHTESDPAVKLIVLTGAGPSFCAGDDLDEIAQLYSHPTPGQPRRPRPSQRDRLAIERIFATTLGAVQNCAVPVLTQVHGHCIGMGLYLVESADLAICADTTNFGHAEANSADPVSLMTSATTTY